MLKKIQFKNLHNLSLLLVGLTIIFSSCTDDPPTCEITSPLDDEAILDGTIVTINVDAEDIDGALLTKPLIVSVEFEIDGILKSTASFEPYSYTWDTGGEALGSHTIKATALDDGENTVSDEISVIVNDAPYCNLTSPENSAIVFKGDEVTISVIATDDVGGINEVNFYQGSSLLGSDNSSPYEYNWSTSSLSTTYYTLKAEAVDYYGEISYETVTIELKESYIIGTWEGEYSGYDANTSSDVEIRRRLNVLADRTYNDTLWGSPYGQNDFIVYEMEIGEWGVNDSQSEVTWSPTLRKQIDISNPGNLEEVTATVHNNMIELSNGNTNWAFRDENLGVDYYLGKQ